MNLNENISIAFKPNITNELDEIIPELFSFLSQSKCNISILSSEGKEIKSAITNYSVNYVSEEKLFKNCNLLITVGGDGTLIGACRNLAGIDTPIFGINMGNLGFTTEFSLSDWKQGLTNHFAGKSEFSNIKLFCAEVFKNEKSLTKSYFLNDAVLNKNDISRMFSLRIESADEHIYDLSGDGLIISSPIGSTAYSLAAGGPIIHQAVDSMVLTPICPHSLTHRPLVIPSKSKLDIKLINGQQPVTLTLDGQFAIPINCNDLIRIQCCNKKTIKLIKNSNRTYFTILKDKFFHGRRETRNNVTK